MAIPDASSTWSNVGTVGLGWACWAAAKPGTNSAAATDNERMDLRIECSLLVLVGWYCPTLLASPVPIYFLLSFRLLMLGRCIRALARCVASGVLREYGAPGVIPSPA